MKNNLLKKISLSSGLAIALAFAAWLPGTANAQDQMPPMKGGEHQMMQMQHITTQAQAEALKPGDSMSMTSLHLLQVMDM